MKILSSNLHDSQKSWRPQGVRTPGPPGQLRPWPFDIPTTDSAAAVTFQIQHYMYIHQMATQED